MEYLLSLYEGAMSTYLYRNVAPMGKFFICGLTQLFSVKWITHMIVWEWDYPYETFYTNTVVITVNCLFKCARMLGHCSFLILHSSKIAFRIACQWSTSEMDIDWATLPRLFYLLKGVWVGCLRVRCLLERFWIYNPVDVMSQWFGTKMV